MLPKYIHQKKTTRSMAIWWGITIESFPIQGKNKITNLFPLGKTLQQLWYFIIYVDPLNTFESHEAPHIQKIQTVASLQKKKKKLSNFPWLFSWPFLHDCQVLSINSAISHCNHSCNVPSQATHSGHKQCRCNV